MKLFSFVISMLLLGSISFAQAQVSGLKNRKIIGVDNLKVVKANGSNVAYKYHTALESIGLISMGCTATHLGQGIVLTAAHCFVDESRAKFKQSCEGTQVFWGVREGKNPTSVSNCRQILVIEYTKAKDYALFKVDNPPKWALPIKLDNRVPYNSRVTIFSHPFKQPLMWSGICEITKSFTSVRVEDRIPMDMISHQCDTNPGSSGAAILDAETLEVVGIHNGGWAEGLSGYNYGTYISTTYIPTVLARIGYRQPRR